MWLLVFLIEFGFRVEASCNTLHTVAGEQTKGALRYNPHHPKYTDPRAYIESLDIKSITSEIKYKINY
jgi:hypothetical protein